MRSTLLGSLLGGLAALSFGTSTGSAARAAEIHAGVHPAPTAILQVLKAFDNPEGAIFSADGRHVFISSAAEIGDRGETFGWTEREGYISKLEVLPNGDLKMVAEKLIDGLTAPLGMGVLPAATGRFPAGTIFLCAGSAPLVDSNGAIVKDPSRLRTKLVAFHEDGEILGEIDTGQGSLFEQINGSPIVLINALGFDAEGNLYVADTAFGADQFEPPFEGKGGLWMIPHGALDALADGQEPAEPPVFLAIPGNPDGVEVSPTNGKVYINTVGPVGGAPDPANGGHLRAHQGRHRQRQAAGAGRRRSRGPGWSRLDRGRGHAEHPDPGRRAAQGDGELPGQGRHDARARTGRFDRRSDRAGRSRGAQVGRRSAAGCDSGVVRPRPEHRHRRGDRVGVAGRLRRRLRRLTRQDAWFSTAVLSAGSPATVPRPTSPAAPPTRSRPPTAPPSPSPWAIPTRLLC
jgi:hypothetical protein